MKKVSLIQLGLLIVGVILLFLSIDSIVYYSYEYVHGLVVLNNWIVILDFIVDIIIIVGQLIACTFAIIQFVRLKDETIDTIVRLGIIMLIGGVISFFLSLGAGEFSGSRMGYEIFESVAYFAFPACYFVLALLLNHYVE